MGFLVIEVIIYIYSGLGLEKVKDLVVIGIGLVLFYVNKVVSRLVIVCVRYKMIVIFFMFIRFCIRIFFMVYFNGIYIGKGILGNVFSVVKVIYYKVIILVY